MAKKSAIQKNEKRERLTKKYASKRARFKAMAKDESLSQEERFNARLKLAELPRNSSPTRIRLRCGLGYGFTVERGTGICRTADTRIGHDATSRTGILPNKEQR